MSHLQLKGWRRVVVSYNGQVGVFLSKDVGVFFESLLVTSRIAVEEAKRRPAHDVP
jgi:hypothetical protein